MATVNLHLAQDPAADKLLSKDPLALLIGMVLDQQVPLEKAFRSAYDLQQRLGRLPSAVELAEMDPDQLIQLFSKRPALHRFPASMAKRVQQMCKHLTEHHSGNAAKVWKNAKTGDELFRNVAALPGFGQQKARIFVALLGKQLGVQPPGWREAAGAFGQEGSAMSIADIVDEESLLRVRSYKKSMKAAAKASQATANDSGANA